MPELINIHNYLPHQWPMLMVDTIQEINSEGVTCVFEILHDNVFCENGFFTEAGLIENAAQTCSSIVAQGYFREENINPAVIGFISSIRKILIHHIPGAGSTIRTQATLISRFDAENYTTCRMECKTYHKEILLLEGEINLFIQNQIQ